MPQRVSRGRHRRWPSIAFALVLAGTFVALLELQARWLGELTRVQREETQQVLASAAERISGELVGTLAVLEEALRESAGGFDASASPLIEEVFPLSEGETPPPEEPAFVLQARDGTRWLVLLDRERLQAELFPALARSALGEGGLETYHVAVVSTLAGVPPLYRSHPDAEASAAPPDASAALSLVPNRWFDLLGARWVERGGPVFVAPSQSDLSPSSPWRVEIRHRSGSLERALASAHRRNLMLAGGLLFVLVLGMAFLWVAEQRARRMAEKELAFVAGISHELRTPLAVLRTAGSNLENGTVSAPARVQEYGALVEREATRLGALVDRVLRFSREAEEAEPMAPIDVEALIHSAIERCSPWRDRRRFAVETQVEEDARTVIGAEQALGSLLQNLLENAIKYGADGQTIRVVARRLEPSPRRASGLFELSVSNPGPSIPRSERRRLFEPFQRGRDVPRDAPGAGLGLAVAREIATAHGGRLELRNGTDVTFALLLPLEAAR